MSGVNMKTASTYPIITIVETMAWSFKKLLKWSTTLMRKKKLQTRASFDRKDSQRIS